MCLEVSRFGLSFEMKEICQTREGDRVSLAVVPEACVYVPCSFSRVF